MIDIDHFKRLNDTYGHPEGDRRLQSVAAILDGCLQRGDDLLARYGGKLPDGRTSSGVLIGAPAGSTVTAVADGTVVFSDWMTGYGMILIVDHGNGYMSLYAHNDTLLKDAGARVSRGDAVAKVGNSGGQGVTALYFELRRGGQPVNPDSWLQRR